MARELMYYEMVVRAGPGLPDASVDVTYFDTDGEVVGRYGQTTIAFATTWKDVAEVIRTGMKQLHLDRDPVHHVSPMVDLT